MRWTRFDAASCVDYSFVATPVGVEVLDGKSSGTANRAWRKLGCKTSFDAAFGSSLRQLTVYCNNGVWDINSLQCKRALLLL